MSLKVSILGSSSATPTLTRFPSAQVLFINGNPILVDCGEGVQMQLIRYGIRAHKIRYVFISHLHPDHYLGLLGLICTLNLQDRKLPLTIFSPAGLEELVYQMFSLSGFHLHYHLEFRILKCIDPEMILETEDFTVESIVLGHRIPTTGFVFRETPQPRKIKLEACQKENLPHGAYRLFKDGKNYIGKKGETYSYLDFTLPPPAPESYAYLSDTVYMPENIHQLKGVRMIYHEATFSSEHAERAVHTFHSTAAQAAEFAKKAGAEKLLIGHFSSRYKELGPLLVEAREIFPETYLAIEGECFRI